jgi:hypothetical protein
MTDNTEKSMHTPKLDAAETKLLSMYNPIPTSGFRDDDTFGGTRSPIGKLTVTAEKFAEMAKLEIPEEMIKSLKNFDYLNIAHALYLLKMHFPTLSPRIIRIQTEHVKDVVLDLPDGRGTMIGVCLVESITGACTEIHWFPVMGNAKGAIKPAEVDPDARKINDNMARAIVKCIAYFTGIGFNIFARLADEDLEEAELGARPKRGKEEKRKLAEEYEDEVLDDDEDPEDEDEDDDEPEDDDDDDDDDEPVQRRGSSRGAARGASRGASRSRLPLRGRRK